MKQITRHSNGLLFVTDWQCLDPADGEAICAFWTREGANVEGAEALRRLREVVAHVVTEDGQIAAVATVAPKILPRLGQPMYAFRCFIGSAWRKSTLARSLVKLTEDVLYPYARELGFPCIGVLLELENERFSTGLRRAYWSDMKMTYIGQNAIGQDVRVWYFPGARLKTREELVVLMRDAQRQAQAETAQLAQAPDALSS
jgi:hypothetical protein